MSMSGAMDPTVMDLPLTDPRCKDASCIAFQAATNLSQAEISYYYQFEYGHWVAWYYSAILAFAALVHFFDLYRTRNRRPASVSRPNLFDKAQAIRRCFSYRRFDDRLGLPSFGMLAFLLLGLLFLFILTFAVRPYYRERDGYGSPPLAIRAGGWQRR